MRALWRNPQTQAFSLSRGDSEASVGWPNSYNELPLECFAQHNVDERVDAAVGIAQADGDVVDIQESKAGPLYSQVGQLEDIIRGPA